MTAAFDVSVADIVRQKPARKRTENMRKISKQALAFGREEYAYDIAKIKREKPKIYADCQARGLGIARPCPYISCRNHLYLDVDERNGSVTVNWPDRSPTEIPETCVKAVTFRHPEGLTLEAVAVLLNLTRERIRMIEVVVQNELRAGLAARGDDVEFYPGVAKCGPDTTRKESAHVRESRDSVLPPDRDGADRAREGDDRRRGRAVRADAPRGLTSPAAQKGGARG